jgi:hypothetical protein
MEAGVRALHVAAPSRRRRLPSSRYLAAWVMLRGLSRRRSGLALYAGGREGQLEARARHDPAVVGDAAA